MVKCSDIGIDNCNYMAMGYKLEEVEQTMFDHIETKHADLLESIGNYDVDQLKHRVSTFLGRSCSCGHHH